MTTDHQMATMYAAQEAVIAALRFIGEPDLAGRLEDCTTTRLARHSGSGWPHICRSAACVWCRRPMIRSWWNGMRGWSAGAASSLAIIPLHSSAVLPGEAADLGRCRRGVEPLRIVVMPQHDRQTITSPVIEAMTVLV